MRTLISTGLLLGSLAAAAASPALAATPIAVTLENDSTAVDVVPGQTQWYQVDLNGGQDYVLYGRADNGTLHPNAFVLYDPTMTKRLAYFGLFATDGGYDGQEFRAPTTGTYHVAIIANQDAPDTVRFGVTFDCKGGKSTKCTLAPGQRAGGYFTYLGDQDFRKIQVVKGKHYTVTEATSLTAEVAVLNANGVNLGHCLALWSKPCKVAFTAAATGPAYLVAYEDDADSHDYVLKLTTP